MTTPEEEREDLIAALRLRAEACGIRAEHARGYSKLPHFEEQTVWQLAADMLAADQAALRAAEARIAELTQERRDLRELVPERRLLRFDAGREFAAIFRAGLARKQEGE